MLVFVNVHIIRNQNFSFILDVGIENCLRRMNFQ